MFSNKMCYFVIPFMNLCYFIELCHAKKKKKKNYNKKEKKKTNEQSNHTDFQWKMSGKMLQLRPVTVVPQSSNLKSN